MRHVLVLAILLMPALAGASLLPGDVPVPGAPEQCIREPFEHNRICAGGDICPPGSVGTSGVEACGQGTDICEGQLESCTPRPCIGSTDLESEPPRICGAPIELPCDPQAENPCGIDPALCVESACQDALECLDHIASRNEMCRGPCAAGGPTDDQAPGDCAPDLCPPVEPRCYPPCPYGTTRATMLCIPDCLANQLTLDEQNDPFELVCRPCPNDCFRECAMEILAFARAPDLQKDTFCGHEIVDWCKATHGVRSAKPGAPYPDAYALQTWNRIEGIFTWDDGLPLCGPDPCVPSGNGVYLDGDCACLSGPPIPSIDSDGDKSFDWDDIDDDCDKLEDALEDNVSWLDPKDGQYPTNLIVPPGQSEAIIRIGVKKFNPIGTRSALGERPYIFDKSGPEPYLLDPRIVLGTGVDDSIAFSLDGREGSPGLSKANHPINVGWHPNGTLSGPHVWPQSMAFPGWHRNFVDVPIPGDSARLPGLAWKSTDSKGIPVFTIQATLMESDPPESKRGVDDSVAQITNPAHTLHAVESFTRRGFEVASNPMWSIASGGAPAAHVDLEFGSNVNGCALRWAAALSLAPSNPVGAAAAKATVPGACES